MNGDDGKNGLVELSTDPKKVHVEHVENCDECPFVHRDDFGELVQCSVDDEVIPSPKHIPGNCPLIEADVLVTIRKP